MGRSEELACWSWMPPSGPLSVTDINHASWQTVEETQEITATTWKDRPRYLRLRHWVKDFDSCFLVREGCC